MRLGALLKALLLIPLLCRAEQGAERYTVAAILPLTGVGASLGDAAQKGIQLALEELPQDVRNRLHVVFENDSSQALQAIAAYKKVQSAGQVAAVISALGNSGHALRPETDGSGTLLFSISVDPSIANESKGAFVLWAPMSSLAKGAVDECKRRGYKKVATATGHHEGNLAMLRAFKEANAGQLEILELPEFDPDESDFGSALTRVRSEKGVDALGAFIHLGRVGLFTRQVRQKGIAVAMFGFANFEDRYAVASSDGAMVGQWYAHLADPQPEFLTRYKERFPSASLLGAANGHDAIMLLAEGLKRNIPQRALAPFIASIRDFHGAMGVYSTLPSHLFSIPIAIKEVTDGGFTQIRAIE